MGIVGGLLGRCLGHVWEVFRRMLTGLLIVFCCFREVV